MSCNLRKTHNITIKDDDTIEISPKFDPADSNIKEDLEGFRRDLEKTLDKFSNDLSKVQFYSSGIFDPNIFEIHQRISNLT